MHPSSAVQIDVVDLAFVSQSTWFARQNEPKLQQLPIQMRSCTLSESRRPEASCSWNFFRAVRKASPTDSSDRRSNKKTKPRLSLSLCRNARQVSAENTPDAASDTSKGHSQNPKPQTLSCR